MTPTNEAMKRDGADAAGGVRWAFLENDLWWPVVLFGTPVEGQGLQHHATTIASPNNMYLFGAQTYTQVDMATRLWRCVEHNTMVHGQAGLAFATTDEVDRFAAAVAEAEVCCLHFRKQGKLVPMTKCVQDYCTAWRRTSSPPPLTQEPSRVPVLIESESSDDMDCTSHGPASSGEDLVRKVGPHEAALQLHWTALVTNPSHETVTIFTSSLDAAISTLLELSALLYMTPLDPCPPTTMAAIYRALTMAIHLHDMNTAMITTISCAPDRQLLNGYLRVMLWALESVARPQLEPYVLAQWNQLRDSKLYGILITTNSMWRMVTRALQAASSPLTCGYVSNAANLLGPSTHRASLRQFEQHFMAYTKSLVEFECDWMTQHNRNRAMSTIQLPPPSVVGTVAPARSRGRPQFNVNPNGLFPPTPPSYATPPSSCNGPSDTQGSVDNVAPTNPSGTPEIVALGTKYFAVTFTSGPLGLILKFESSRIVVTRVQPNSQAQRIGLIAEGDAIVKVQNIAINANMDILQRIVKSKLRPLHVTFRRRTVIYVPT